ncbi:MAG TPA: sigma-70 family RNA polymerase sigma factor [Bryobacteraceae bacterium]|nr:sigma-70 family RNA polymerase sigma factor [Bryobacteraceae bacterium]
MASSAEHVPRRSDVLSDDRALVERVCSDDQNAIEDLLTLRCGPVIRYLSRQYLYEDLQNELYVHLKENDWRRLRSWQGRSSISAWVKQVAINLCLKHSKERPALEPVEKLGELVSDGNDGHYGHEARLRRLDLLKAIRALADPREQFLIIQNVLRDRSIPDVAAELGVTREHADVIKHRAVGHLREWLLREGGNP